MNAFVATPPAAETETGQTIAIDGWFPDIELDDIRNKVRIGEGVVTHDRLVAAVEGAILTALRQLARWRSDLALEGVASLESIDDLTIGGIKRPVLLWQRIVRYFAAAELADGYRDISATDEGNDRADELKTIADDYRRLAGYAVTDLISTTIADDEPPRPRNAVALI